MISFIIKYGILFQLLGFFPRVSEYFSFFLKKRLGDYKPSLYPHIYLAFLSILWFVAYSLVFFWRHPLQNFLLSCFNTAEFLPCPATESREFPYFFSLGTIFPGSYYFSFLVFPNAQISLLSFILQSCGIFLQYLNMSCSLLAWSHQNALASARSSFPSTCCS